MIEIEKKAYLRDQKVLDKVKQISEYKGFVEKIDRYYGPESQQIDCYNDRVFRLRKENGKTILSYKKKSFLKKTEVNHEYEMNVSSVSKEDLEGFFQYLGFQPFIDKNKKSHIYIIANKNGYPVTIEHNFIEGLGEFIEIEVLTENESDAPIVQTLIAELFAELGIREEDIEPRYYIDLLSGRNKK